MRIIIRGQVSQGFYGPQKEGSTKKEKQRN